MSPVRGVRGQARCWKQKKSVWHLSKDQKNFLFLFWQRCTRITQACYFRTYAFPIMKIGWKKAAILSFFIHSWCSGTTSSNFCIAFDPNATHLSTNTFTESVNRRRLILRVLFAFIRKAVKNQFYLRKITQTWEPTHPSHAHTHAACASYE